MSPTILPATLQNRRRFDTHSVFDMREFSDEINVIYVHLNGQGPTTFFFNARAKMLTATMNKQAYGELWNQLWRAKNPGLTIVFEGRERVQELRVTEHRCPRDNK